MWRMIRALHGARSDTEREFSEAACDAIGGNASHERVYYKDAG